MTLTTLPRAPLATGDQSLQLRMRTGTIFAAFATPTVVPAAVPAIVVPWAVQGLVSLYPSGTVRGRG